MSSVRKRLKTINMERVAWKLYPAWREAVRTKQPREESLYDFFGYLNFAIDGIG